MMKRILLALAGLLAFSSAPVHAASLSQPCYTVGVAAPCIGASTTTPLPVGTTPGVANRATYIAWSTAYAAYATPTDLFCIWGSSTKTVYISNMGMGINTTAAAVQNFTVIKRITANSGGTPTNLTATLNDSTSAAATAVATIYGAAPTTGNSGGTIRVQPVVSSAPTSAPAVVSLSQTVAPGSVALAQPITLRGTGEGVCWNYGGAALTAGFSAYVFAEWEEI